MITLLDSVLKLVVMVMIEGLFLIIYSKDKLRFLFSFFEESDSVVFRKIKKVKATQLLLRHLSVEVL